MSSRTEWKKRKIDLGSAVIGVAISLVIGFGAGFYYPTLSQQFSPYLLSGKTYNSPDWSSLDQVYFTLTSNYDGEIDQAALIEGAKKGIAAALGDPYTAYMDATETADFNKSLHGNVGAGIGIEIGQRNGYIKVLRTLPDNPARTAGILAGDIIYAIDGETISEQTASEVSTKIRGPVGTQVAISVLRNNQILNFDLTRAIINNVSTYIKYVNNTAIITITRFDSDTGDIIQGFAEDFPSHQVDKVILDLRGNGGGFVSAVKTLLSLWLDGEKILIQKSKHTADEITYTDRGQARLKDLKTIVLVDGNTASAAEIAAGALQDYQKATIVGTNTFGKGVVQKVFNLPLNTSLKVTVSHWYTPRGSDIALTGITPDIEVEITAEDINAERDPQMDKAKEL